MEWGPHLTAICQHLEAVARGDILNLLITIPPGSTKSTLVSVAWPVWCWLTQPGLKFLTGSNDIALSIRDATAARYLIEDDWFRQRWGHVFQLKHDQNEKKKYQNTRMGFRQITSVGSRITGKKGDILLLDDPNDAEKMNSEPDVDRAIRWHDRAFFNRVNNPKTGRRVYIGQRCGVRDVIGHAKKRGDFVELCIPEEFEPERRVTTPIGWTDWRAQKGEWLRENRFGPAQKAEALKTLGALGYAGQHQQRPTDPEGSLFKLHWFKTYRLTPLRDGFIFLDGSVVPRGECTVFVVIDPATGKGSTGDFTALMTFAVTPDGRILVLDCVNERIPIEKLVSYVRRIQAQWGPEFVAVEANGFQMMVVNQIRAETTLAVKEVHPNLGHGPQKSKRVRAQKAMVMAEAGQVWIPADASEANWLDEFLEELQGFTGDEGGLDNRTDVLSYACHLSDELVSSRGSAPRTVGGRGADSPGPVSTGTLSRGGCSVPRIVGGRGR